jgi:hypothetical protein
MGKVKMQVWWKKCRLYTIYLRLCNINTGKHRIGVADYTYTMVLSHFLKETYDRTRTTEESRLLHGYSSPDKNWSNAADRTAGIAIQNQCLI